MRRALSRELALKVVCRHNFGLVLHGPVPNFVLFRITPASEATNSVRLTQIAAKKKKCTKRTMNCAQEEAYKKGLLISRKDKKDMGFEVKLKNQAVLES